MLFSDKDILTLTSLVSKRLSEKRFSHTVGVMNMAEKLSDCYLPEQKDLAKVSALLHDISKEVSREENMAIPNYVYDCHTIRGKKMGKTKKQFFIEEENALVNRQMSIFDLDLTKNY